jgi:integrase
MCTERPTLDGTAMTVPVRVAAADPRACGDDSEGWRTFLARRLEPTWRSGEWCPDTLIFTGDPNNPKTFVYLCADPDCRNPNGVRNTLCPYCVAKRKPRSRTLSRRFHDSPFEPCVVTVGEARCERPRYSGTGLCFTHQSRYTQANKTHGIGLDEFLTTAAPLVPVPACAVAGCRHQVFHRHTPLCSTHHHQFRACTENGGLRIGQHEFAARALPLIRSHEFTLVGCSATVAVEVLWILQERDRRGFGISILRMRNLLKTARGAATLFEVTPSNEHVAKLLRTTLPPLRRQRALFEGVDPTLSDRWGPDVLERFPSVQGTRSRNIVIDWSAVDCGWLRRLDKMSAIETLPHYETLRPVLQALTWASRALRMSQAFIDPKPAGRADVAAIIGYCRRQTTSSGSPFESDYVQRRLWELKAILTYCRSAGHMDDVPGAFALTTVDLKGRPTSRRRDDDEPGRALPDAVVDILDRNLDRLRPSMTAQYRIQGWSNDDYGLMRQTIYQLLRDTGRRPGEITALRRNCLATDPGGGPVLIYTNSKTGRINRRLHITAATADIVTTWLARIAKLRPERDTAYLFPQVHRSEPRSEKPFKASAFGVIFRAWVDAIPELTPLLRTSSRPEGIIDRRDVVAYSLRHLRPAPRRRRYPCRCPRRITRSRKCRCHARVLPHRTETETRGDRTCRGVGDGSARRAAAAHRSRRIRTAVGLDTAGWLEPSNVKSGRKSCPIRFQCGGCDHYRPDPSYIPEIEQEIRKIRADVLEAQLCAAPQVVDNLRYNLAMFESILDKMTVNLGQLDPKERAALDAAIGTIRRARELHRNALPLFVTERPAEASTDA